ncbi:MAG TPA: DUF6714 family protein [Methylomirabilota bacterium]|nr:DUF6714 family protein [Methylomirabilota bacterium]
MDIEKVEAQIISAFASVEYPGDWCLRGSNEGDEPYLLEQEFKGKTNWRILDPKFLDQAPSGYSSALSFFSDEAFHFYLPGYLIADLRGQLEQSRPFSYLSLGLDDDSRNQQINPRRYGARTWFDHAQYRFSMFNRDEALAIVAYLTWARDADDYARPRIDEALRNYWNPRATGVQDR